MSERARIYRMDEGVNAEGRVHRDVNDDPDMAQLLGPIVKGGVMFVPAHTVNLITHGESSSDECIAILSRVGPVGIAVPLSARDARDWSAALARMADLIEANAKRRTDELLAKIAKKGGAS
jgi:hypothetical protein